MQARPIAVVGFLVMSTLLSGCSSGPDCRPTVQEGSKKFSAPNNTADYGTEADVADPYRLTVRVASETEDGPPVPNVKVVAIAAQTVTTTRRCGEGTDDTTTDTRIEYFAAANAKSNPQGTVTLDVEPRPQVRIAVAESIDHHGESLPNVILGPAGGTGDVIVAVLRKVVPFSFNGTMAAGLAAHEGPAPPTPPLWQSHPFVFHDDDSVHATYLERLVSIQAALTWSNAPTSFGDLRIGLGLANEQPFHVAPNQKEQTPLDTHAEEGLAADHRVLGTVRDAYLNGTALSASAVSYRPVLTLNGLPYSVGGEARFEYEPEFVVS